VIKNMEVELTTVKENPLMDRREVKAEVKHEGEATPSKEDVKSRLAADLGLESENINVKHVYTGYGNQSSEAFLNINEEFEYDESLEEETIEEPEEDTDKASGYEDIVSGTITEAKEALKEMDEPDFEAALKAEEKGKNRTTLIDWLENQA
jgi:small subunit ribosomal protein S24e